MFHTFGAYAYYRDKSIIVFSPIVKHFHPVIGDSSSDKRMTEDYTIVRLGGDVGRRFLQYSGVGAF